MPQKPYCLRQLLISKIIKEWIDLLVRESHLKFPYHTGKRMPKWEGRHQWSWNHLLLIHKSALRQLILLPLMHLCHVLFSRLCQKIQRVCMPWIKKGVITYRELPASRLRLLTRTPLWKGNFSWGRRSPTRDLVHLWIVAGQSRKQPGSLSKLGS